MEGSADLPPTEERRLVAALRSGEEHAFAELVDRHHAAMVRLARAYVGSDATAEDVVQDAWSAVVRGIDRFEGRSSLKTWLFSIVKNRAASACSRERRSLPLSSLEVGPETVLAGEHSPACEWTPAPRAWEDAGRRLLSLELRDELRRALEDLPVRQRLVVGLRDVEGLQPAEVCRLLDLSKENQRVLLHRGRTRLRQALVDAFEDAVQLA